jgi:hypothetical protein
MVQVGLWGPVDRHGLRPRDDKSGVLYHEGSEVIGAFTLSLRGGSEARDAAIHRVQGRADGVGGSVTGLQWIATGLQPSR